MTSDDFLINHAYAKAWCAPEQDRQHRFRPARLSPPIGVRGSTDLIWTRYQLPTQGDWYHLYQVGPVIYSNLGLNLKQLSWTAASQQMVLERMTIDVYTESGIMIPRERVFFLATPDGNLAIAVQDIKSLGDFGTEPLYFRFYSNAYFEKADSNDVDEGIEYKYMMPNSTDNISTISKVYRDMLLKSGKTYAFVNGRKVQAINVATVKRGDMVEVIRDSSIREIIEFPVAQLETFLSNLDSAQKYFLHQTAKTDDSIDYRDDLDIFLIKRVNANGYTGVYYHCNAEDSIRMVTHRDYSIPVEYVERYAALHPTMSVVSELTVQLVIRRGGMNKPLIDEAHHIRELYKLSDAAFMDAVIGTEATVSVWKAAALEDSMYPAIMRAPDSTITRKMVEDAYGYNAISKLLADTPQKVVNANRWVELPFGLRGQSTVYEYDANGILLGWFINTNVQWYVARNVNCQYIEAFVGKGGRTSSTVFGGDAQVSTIYNYRCYVCNMVNGFPDDRWIDVTGDPAYYTVVGKGIVWAVDRKKFYTAIKMDDSFLTYNLDLNYADGLLRFSLNVEEVRLDGTPYLNLSEIPMGVLELWLNGHSLIEGLDWFMKGKEICIVNKVWRKRDGTPNRITIRGTGFCNKDMSRVKQSEFGYVEQGWLSRNNRWNLRDDKVIRVTAGGRIYERTDLDWVEDKPGVMLTNVANGAPYQVIEPIIPLRGVTLDDTYAMRMLAEATDKEIEDYMTEKMGQPVIEGPNIIPGPHVLYSPFISKIMHDLDDGYIHESDIDNAAYSDNLVKQLSKPYEWLLAYEPTSKNLSPDYVNVHPHESYEPFELGLYQYNFLRRVIKIYLKDKVNISQFISIRPLA